MKKKNNTVLIVDDEEGMRETISEILKRKGFKTDLAGYGKEAILKTDKQFYEVVVLDIRLPDMDGVEILKRIKKKTPDTEVVIITAFASLQSSVEALNEGAFAYIMKPFEMDSLVRTILSAKERYDLITENRQLRTFNENIIQSMDEGVMIEDEKGLINFINPKMEELFRAKKGVITGRRLIDFVSEGHKEKIKTGKHVPRKGIRYEAALKNNKNNERPVLISTVPLYEQDKYTGSLSVLSDITQVKKLENQLTSKLSELEHFNKLMVGRELRMVELKERIKELETPKTK